MQVIGKFNKMIANKIVWSIFSVIVVVSFVAIGGFSGSQGKQKEVPAGKLWGKEISYKDFYSAKSQINPVRGDVVLDTAEQNKLAWQRIAVDTFADRLGLRVPDQEIGEWISEQDYFKDESGAYSEARHEQIAKQQFGGTRNPMKALDQFLAREFMQEKMVRTLNDITWISPLEMREQIDRLTDTFDVSYVRITESNLTEKITVSDEEVSEYFTAHQEEFMLPVQRRVKYVEFPYSDYTNNLAVSDQEIENYYEENKASEFFQTMDTNTGTLSLRALEDVSPMIREFLLQDKAVQLARNDANNIVDRLIPDYDGNAATIDFAASSENRVLSTSEWFTQYGYLENLDVGHAFTEAAFSLDPSNPNKNFSLPINGADACYVISYMDEKEPSVPPLEDVNDEVREQAIADKTQKGLRDLAQSTLDSLKKAVKIEGKPITNAVAGIEVVDLEPFGLIDTPDELLARNVADGLANRQSGEFLDVVPTADGYLVIYLENRTPGTGEGTEMLRENIMMTSNRLLTQSLFSELPDYVLASGNLQTAMALPGKQGESGETDEDSDQTAN
jgi:hypothetical protein